MVHYFNLKQQLKKLYFTLLPFNCILCNQISHRKQDFCDECFHALPKDCLINNQTFQTIHAGFVYEKPLSPLITALKFHHQLVYARLMGEWLADRIQERWYTEKPLPEIILPIPLHAERLKTRGFNQAYEIAKPIAKILNIPLLKNATERIKATKPQASLAAKERHHNVKKAFRVIAPLSFKHIAVVDDVITTGHTLHEFCKTVREAGIEAIDVWCCARTRV